MRKIKMAILGAGNIASNMASTIMQMDSVIPYAVAARDLQRAEAFAEKYGIEKAYGSYEEMLSDDEVELVYIATPHSHHFEHGMLCLKHGKHILCEKSFTANAKQAKELLQTAKENNLLAAEAIWVRYMPMAETIREVVASGIIGRITTVTANLGYVVEDKERMQKPELAGGSLLDLGVYVINFASIVLGEQVKKVESSVVKTDTGVDAQNNIVLHYENGELAVLQNSMLSLMDRRGMIYGNNGYIEIENINNFESVKVFDLNYNCIKEYKKPEQITGFEYQVEACVNAICNGMIECPQMPHSEIIRIMELMDSLRKDWGVVYPFD